MTGGEREGLLRLFVAIELDEQIRQALARVIEELRRQGLEDLRWVPPEGIHLTLKFLGETPTGKLEAIKEALAGAVEGVRLHRLSLGRLGTFGSRRAPTVLWIDVNGDLEVLRGLQGRVERRVAPLGFPAEKRGFTPHLTLARIRPDTARNVAGPLEEALRQIRPPRQEMEVRELSLMKSELRRGGAAYERLGAFPLK